MKVCKMQAPAGAAFSALLLLVGCGKGGLGLSAHRDGGMTGSGGVVSPGSGGTPTGSGGSYPSVSSGGGFRGSGGTLNTGAGDMPGTSGGSSGAGGSGPISSGPLGGDGWLYSGATQDLKVSQDERHVAFMRDYLPLPSCSTGSEAARQRAQAVGTLLVATLADNGTVAVRVVGQSVKSVGFSADSKSMAFVDGYDPCSRGGDLKVAAADGTNSRTIASVPASFHEEVTGNTLLFVFPDNGVGDQEYALWMPNGAPVAMPGYSASLDLGLVATQDGRYLAYFDAARAVTVLDVSTGKSHHVDPGTNSATYDKLAFSSTGEFLALETSFAHGQDKGWLEIVATDGTKATTLANDYTIQTGEFSPDGSQLAYFARNDSSGMPEIVVHPVAGGTNVHDQGLPDPASNWIDIGFTPDGAMLFVRAPDADRSSAGASLYMAPASANGSLQLIASGTNGIPIFSPGNGNLVIARDAGSTEVRSLDGSDSHLLSGTPTVYVSGTSAVYEPNSKQPRLLLNTDSGPSGSVPQLGFLLASTDGTNPNTFRLPSVATSWDPSPQWVGHSVVYGFHTDVTAGSPVPGPIDGIYAYGGSSSSPGVSSIPILLADRPDKYALARIPVPTRLFYARAAASTAGPAGLWMVTVP